jgi:hypothetical protein
MDRHILFRLGTFFTLIGGGLLIIFGASVLAKDISFSYLLFASAALLLGYIFHRAAPRPTPARFSSIRNARQRSRQRREDQQIKEDQEK